MALRDVLQKVLALPVVDAFGRSGGLGPEMLVDGDMEAGTGWSGYGTPTTSEQSTEQVHGGTYSWKTIADSAVEGISQTFLTGAIADKVYRVRGWCYSSTGSIHLRIRNGDATAWLFNAAVPLGGTNSWQPFEVFFTETIGGVGGGGVRLASTAAGIIYFDDVSVRQVY